MSDNKNLPSLENLWAEAFADGTAETDDGQETVGVSESEETENDVEQVEVEGEKVPAKLSDVFGQEEEDSSPTQPDYMQEIILPDGTKATLRQLIDGNMMRAKFTQGTQELAEEKKKLSAANELYELLSKDPVGTIAQMAQRAGLLEEDSYTSRRSGKNVSIKDVLGDESDEDAKIAAIVEAKAKELFEAYKQSDPAFNDIEVRRAQSKVDAEFDRIEQTYGAELDEADRQAVIQQAIKANDPNLEYHFLRMKAALDAEIAKSERVKQGQRRKSESSSQPKATQGDLKVNPPKTIEESFRMAELALENA